MVEETEIHDNYGEAEEFPETWRVSMPFGKFVRMPIEEARELLRSKKDMARFRGALAEIAENTCAECGVEIGVIDVLNESVCDKCNGEGRWTLYKVGEIGVDEVSLTAAQVVTCEKCNGSGKSEGGKR